ncbi:hypothetical protein CYLTODRAFT_74852 [Cylindrobasidium torrendii FP15055 ss-10]|uniref:F-box domain-containing protein n=1 Tax=Cylindrobasidium torrendii FP15055 ss-10 TaxID=1314674 RepID=A0A0D7B4F6_9AGAR|nr:hypothetical protein CYLTODRAFT_74852 [Cylindrobasidium torrendii FP15055 ss-10]
MSIRVEGVEVASRFELYTHLPPELRAKISKLALDDIICKVKADRRNRNTRASLSSILYAFATTLDVDVIRHIVLETVRFRDSDNLYACLRKIPKTPGLATAITQLKLYGTNMTTTVDWDLMAIARRYMHRLTTLKLTGVVLDTSRTRDIVTGLALIVLERCQFTNTVLFEIMSCVQSIVCKDNRITLNTENVDRPLSKSFDLIEVEAKSPRERCVYRQILAVVQSVKKLRVSGIGRGWIIDSWEAVDVLVCKYGMPAKFNAPVSLSKLILATTLASIDTAIDVLAHDCSSYLIVKIELPDKFVEVDKLLELWRTLDRCKCAITVRVEFCMYGVRRISPYPEDMGHIFETLRRSNSVYGGSILCPRALISVARRYI